MEMHTELIIPQRCTSKHQNNQHHATLLLPGSETPGEPGKNAPATPCPAHILSRQLVQHDRIAAVAAIPCSISAASSPPALLMLLPLLLLHLTLALRSNIKEVSPGRGRLL